MRKRLFILLLCITALTSCEDDQNPVLDDDSAVEFQGKNAVIRAGDLSSIRFKNLPSSVSLDETTAKGEIRVEATGALDGWLEAKEEGGELRIEGKEGLPSALDLHFHIHPRDIRKIVVEGDNRVFIESTPVLDYLELVTEGESELVMHDLKVRDLKSRREGKSRMFLSSELLDFDLDRIFFLASAVQVHDERYVVYRKDNLDYMLFAPQLFTRNDTVFALGNGDNDPLRSFFITRSHELVNQGESYLDALELPTLAINSKNEGESESKVWAVGQLNVKGEGESVMYYLGFPDVNKDMKGSSRLIHLH